MKTTLSIKNLMDRETDRQKAKHRDEGILTGGEQTKKNHIPFRISTATKNVQISASIKKCKI